MTYESDVMNGFKFLKGLMAKYGEKDAADLVALADRLVAQGQFKTRVEAVKAIEEQLQSERSKV